MLSEVHVEGFITKKIWQHSGDTYFRYAIYRDPSRPRKQAARANPSERDEPDYITVRVPAALTTLPVEFQAGQRVQVHGWLESREFDYSLAEFLESAQGEKPKIEPALAEKLTTNRGTTWLVAERIVTLSDSGGRTGRNNSK